MPPILPERFRPYRKTLAAVVIGVLGWATAVVQSPAGPVSASEWITLATVVVTALGVYAYPNRPTAPVVPDTRTSSPDPQGYSE